MIEINTSTGRVRLVTFKQFLALVNKFTADDNDKIGCNFQISAPLLFQHIDEYCIPAHDSDYEQRQYRMMDNPNTTENLLKLFHEFTTPKPTDETTLPYILEDACVQAAMDYMNPNVIVILGERRFVVTDTVNWRLWKARTKPYAVLTSDKLSPIFTAPISIDQQIKRWGKPLLEVLDDEDGPNRQAAINYLMKLDRTGGSLAVK